MKCSHICHKIILLPDVFFLIDYGIYDQKFSYKLKISLIKRYNFLSDAEAILTGKESFN